jgi:TonB family protein
VRPWRGRSALFQVVSKGERQRGSVPALGQGLDREELERLAAQQRTVPPPPRPESQDPDFKPATVVQQAQAQYPQGIQESAEVTVQVDVGLSDDYIGARVLRSTNPIFDQSALDAAQRSTYRSARRAGIPERGTLNLVFRYVAPGQPMPSQAPADTTRHD